MIDQDIINLVKNNPGQMNEDEYQFIKNFIQRIYPSNILIFGVGYDSKLWIETNKNGKTIFLENDQNWIDKIKKENLNMDVRLIEYSCNINDYAKIIDDENKLKINLPSDIISEKWDLIIIDSPLGGTDNCPGRMQSIYMASILNCSHYLLHDCNRNVEKLYGKKYLKNKLYSINSLNYYRKEI